MARTPVQSPITSRFPLGALVRVRTATTGTYNAAVRRVEEPPHFPLSRVVVRLTDGTELRLTESQLEYEVSLVCAEHGDAPPDETCQACAAGA